ncbi:PTHB1 N-terminus-domain-containing protein [Obelidium mucronatum]|nr:PTHB1 N-terminus-domain-containing protein [Obelidium mucronatum]
MISVQSVDGIVSIIDGGSLLCLRKLPRFILPGPLKYVFASDSLVTFSSDLCLESYSIRNLIMQDNPRALSLDGPPIVSKFSSNPIECTWSVLLGELILEILVGRFFEATPPNENDIVAVGVQNCFVYSDHGESRFQTNLEYGPRYCLSYPLHQRKSDSSNNSLSNLVILSKSGTLFIYKNLKVSWISKCNISSLVHLCFGSFCGLPNFVVQLYENGNIAISAICLFSADSELKPARSLTLDHLERELRIERNRKHQRSTPYALSNEKLVAVAIKFIPQLASSTKSNSTKSVLYTVHICLSSKGRQLTNLCLVLSHSSAFSLSQSQFIVPKLGEANFFLSWLATDSLG